MKELNIVKIGGSIVNDTAALNTFLKRLSQMPGRKILVHGGGNKATEVLQLMGMKPKMIGGRRITDEASLEVVTMVYAGLLNKQIVAILQESGCGAIGLTGADGNSIRAHKRVVKDIDYGFAGDIDAVNTELLCGFLEGELTPVFCAITHDGQGQLLNTNADTVAAELAVALSPYYEVTLNYIFEHTGVLEHVEDSTSVIPVIDSKKYKQLLEDKIIAGGMLPKLHNCFVALERGVKAIRIGNEALVEKNRDRGTLLTL
jgi:acetylglutamate kinase